MSNLRYLGLDVHAETIPVARREAERGGPSLGEIPNGRKRSGAGAKTRVPEQWRAWYEAGPTGYVLYWQLTGPGVACDVVVPTLAPLS